MDQLAKANGVGGYGHALRKDRNNFLRRALDYRAKGMRKRGRPKKTSLEAVLGQLKSWAERK